MTRVLPERRRPRWLRRVLCAIGVHRWQWLLAPPTYQTGDDYEAGVWCIFCSRRYE